MIMWKPTILQKMTKRDRIVDLKDIIIKETTNNLSKDVSDFGSGSVNLEFGQSYKSGSRSGHILAEFVLPVYAHFLYSHKGNSSTAEITLY